MASKPYYDDGNGIVIYHGDCREILPHLDLHRPQATHRGEAASVDVVEDDLEVVLQQRPGRSDQSRGARADKRRDAAGDGRSASTH